MQPGIINLFSNLRVHCREMSCGKICRAQNAGDHIYSGGFAISASDADHVKLARRKTINKIGNDCHCQVVIINQLLAEQFS